MRARAAVSWALRHVSAIALGGFAYGLISSKLPPARFDGEFWAANLAAPYFIFPALAGWRRHSVRLAGLSGVVTCVMMELGFYDVFSVWTATANNEGLPSNTPRHDVILHAYVEYFRTLVLGGPLAAAVVVGLASGMLAYMLNRRRRYGPAYFVAGVLILEPIFLAGHVSRYLGLSATRYVPWGVGIYDYRPSNLLVWGIEEVLGVALLICGIFRATHARPEPRSSSPN
jgi:hypothetical protein